MQIKIFTLIKLLFTFILLLSSTSMLAQDISVAEFYLNDTDLTANLQGTTVIDQNGEKCALIKIETTQTGFTFDVGVLGVMETRQKTGEIWVYVPAGVKKITIQHQQLGTLRDYYFPERIEKAKTYIMRLTTGTVQTVVKEAKTSQYIVFNVNPKDAIVMLNDEPLEVVDGTAMKYVKFGTYDYRVEMGMYHPEVGKVIVDDPQNKNNVNVTLQPAFGWLDLKSNANNKDATVYLDGNRLGIIPMKSDRLPSGQHHLKLIKAQYKPLETDVTITDNNTTTLTPSLTANFVGITLKVEDGAEIWINNERKGTGTWTGNLTFGEYIVHCKKAGHEDSERTLTITPGMAGQTISLNVPTPIYGSIDVSVLPANADIYLDGQNVGQTPLVLENILVGDHNLIVKKDTYATLNQTITIKRDETVTVSKRLTTGRQVTITADKSNAVVFIDGKEVGPAPYYCTLTFGKHEFYALAEGKQSDKQDVSVTEGNGSMNVALKFFKKETTTLQHEIYRTHEKFDISIDVAGKSFGTSLGVGIGVTTNLAKNFEIAPSFNYFFVNNCTLMEVEADFHYDFQVANNLNVYPIVGGVFYSAKPKGIDATTKLGVNFGAGTEYFFAKRIAVFVEGSYLWIDGFDDTYYSLGVKIGI